MDAIEGIQLNLSLHWIKGSELNTEMPVIQQMKENLSKNPMNSIEQTV
jgi:hypothetical protein